MAFTVKKGTEEYDGRNDHNGRSCGHIAVEGHNQTQDAGKQGEQHGEEVVFPHICGYISGGSRRQDQKGVCLLYTSRCV